jgi:prevent-host-death family protein
MVTRPRLVTMSKKEKTIAAGEFKAKCLALLDQVELRGTTLVVTKRGRPVARVVPLRASPPNTLLGSLLYEEDLLSPVDVPWEAAE